MLQYSKLVSCLKLLWLLITVAYAANTTANTSTKNERALIVGGEEASSNQYNWFVKIGNRAGVLIAPEFFITKANYADYLESEFEEGKCRIGALCNEEGNCGQDFEDREMEEFFVHPEYANGGPNLMLVKLSTPSTITPLSVDAGSIVSSFTTGRDHLFVAGFGTTDVEIGSNSDKLLHLDQTFVSNQDCETILTDNDSDFVISDQVLCAKNSDLLKSACYNDGGGPLYDSINNVLVGIVSTGSDDCKNLPVVYERIDYQWMKTTVCEEHGEPKPEFCTKQKTYFKVVSQYEHENDHRWCLTRLHPNIWATVIVEKCDAKNNLQLWKIDGKGQLKSYNDDGLCMKNNRNKKKFSMKKCQTDVGSTFVFDAFHNSLIWLKNKSNIQRWGFRAIAIMNDPETDVSSYGVYVRKRNDDVLQKWRIEYPDMLEI